MFLPSFSVSRAYLACLGVLLSSGCERGAEKPEPLSAQPGAVAEPEDVGDASLPAVETPVEHAGPVDAGALDSQELDAGLLDDGGEPDDGGVPEDGGSAGVAPVPWGSLAAGGFHSCVVSPEGPRCWGAAEQGQLAAPASERCTFESTRCARVAAPVSLPEGLTMVNVSAGRRHTCARFSNGEFRCWGLNAKGQLGLGHLNSQSVPALVPHLGQVVHSSASLHHTCAVLSDTTVKCWGSNEAGQLGGAGSQGSCPSGRGGYVPCARSPVAVPGLTGAVRVAAGAHHTCALKADGTVWCWGNNYYGQLGDGTTVNRAAPTPVTLAQGAIHLSAGSNHTCALLASGQTQCWGGNGYGQLGDGTGRDQPSPVFVEGLAGATRVSSGFYHTCAALKDGTARCWGLCHSGRCGTLTSERCAGLACSKTPLPVARLGAAVEVEAGGYHTCATRQDGSVWCWGEHDEGQLGRGDLSSEASHEAMPVVGVRAASP